MELFLRLLSFTITFQHWTKFFWTFDGNFFIRDCKTAFYLYRKFYLNFITPKDCICFFYRFWVLTKNCWNFCRKISRRFLEGAFSVSPTTIWGKWFLKLLFNFYHFRTFIKKNFGWFAKSSREFPKLPFRCPEEPLVWLGFFWLFVFYSLPFGLWAKNVGVLLEGLGLRPRSRCQNCVPCV